MSCVGKEFGASDRIGRAMWPRETTARSGDIVAEYDGQRQSQSLWVLQRGTARSGSMRKTPESLAAETTGSC